MEFILHWLSENKDIVLAFCALSAMLTGFLSILLTTITLCINRKHYRLSVRPILRTDRIIDIGKPASIILVNNGLGPALIDSIITIVNDKILPPGNNDIRTKEMEAIGLREIIFNTIVENEPYMPGHPQMLYETSYPITNVISLKNHCESFDKITIKISYHSIYNEKFSWTDNPEATKDSLGKKHQQITG